MGSLLVLLTDLKMHGFRLNLHIMLKPLLVFYKFCDYFCRLYSLMNRPCYCSDCNWTRTQNHLVLKRTLNHLAKLTKWLSCVLSTYLYGAFDCMYLSCHVCVSGNYEVWIHSETRTWHDKYIQSCYCNLFQIMGNNNFRNLNGVIFTQ